MTIRCFLPPPSLHPRRIQFQDAISLRMGDILNAPLSILLNPQAPHHTSKTINSRKSLRKTMTNRRGRIRMSGVQNIQTMTVTKKKIWRRGSDCKNLKRSASRKSIIESYLQKNTLFHPIDHRLDPSSHHRFEELVYRCYFIQS